MQIIQDYRAPAEGLATENIIVQRNSVYARLMKIIRISNELLRNSGEIKNEK